MMDFLHNFDQLEQVIRYFLAFFYTFVAVFYIFLISKKQSQCGASLIHMGHRFSLHWWNHLTFRMFRIVIWAVCVLRVFFPETDNVLMMLTSINIPIINYVGVLLLVLGFSLTVYCNFILNNTWRSGIDEQQTTLITSAVYAKSRNPAYIGVAASQFGFFLAMPSVFSLACLVIGVSALRIQISLEEDFLNKVHQQEYTKYKQKVPRYF
jgi:protein-S-isoprenylcysteine O-methyltransferase Ste14